MSTVSVVYTEQAVNDLKRLDQALVKRVVKKIAENARMDDPLARAKSLRGSFSGMYRYRIGDHRAVFVIDKKQRITLLTIITVRHRKEVYR